ncbi:Sua5/YciO/YrdC/YwlC family protein [Halothiobacillus sp.]|uniref:L-threonylcarbamoyladenylate synthase n=1 Tax=Halothiobacillus sp. TaxID=1891311 RepID=UPI002619A04D|nr:Sua5/YciO/YrdC/YwlC family protein [Halothiobacillus sp.]MDD4965360.1 Sua5/YciO/YrdC/YwlC family protein [Halothiobacillus sp.]
MHNSPFRLRLTGQIVSQGGVIAYPTEAVFGLGCDPLDEIAVERILTLKQRDWRKGLILLAANLEQIHPWISLSSEELARISAHWPGPSTWVVPASQNTPDWITGGRDEVAVRVTAHPVAAALAQAANTAIVSTSANPAQRPPARSALAVRRYFDDRLEGILTGPVDTQAQPTPIRHWRTGDWLRR